MTTILATSSLGAEAVAETAEVQNKIASSGLGAETVIATAEAQKGLAAARLAAAAATGSSRLTQMYALMNTTLAQQDDAVEVLAYLLAVISASRCKYEYQTSEVISEVCEQATLALDEIYGLRAMPLHRPDFDQMAELIRDANTARAASGLGALPVLKQ